MPSPRELTEIELTVIAMRKHNIPWTQIAQTLGLHPSRCRRAFQRAWREGRIPYAPLKPSSAHILGKASLGADSTPLQPAYKPPPKAARAPELPDLRAIPKYIPPKFY